MRTLPNLLSVALLASFAILAAASFPTEGVVETELSSADKEKIRQAYADALVTEVKANEEDVVEMEFSSADKAKIRQANADALAAEAKATGVTSENAAAMEVSATRLYADYVADNYSADQRYNGKELLVSGVVVKVGVDIAERRYVMLKGGSKAEFDPTLETVLCYFSDSHAGELTSLREGMNITIKGRCIGYAQLKRCSIRR